MNEQTFQKFKAISEKVPNAAHPFVPYVGEHYSKSSPRVMFIGKSTAGWDYGTEELSLAAAQETVNDFIQNEIVEGNYHSSWWAFLRQVTLDLHGGDQAHWSAEKSRSRAFEKLIWSNIAKVGGSSGNPSGQLWRKQEPLLVPTLRSELKKLKPSHVICPVGNWGGSVLERLFPERFCASQANVWICESDEFQCCAFWMRHPQGWQLEQRNKAVRLICSH